MKTYKDIQKFIDKLIPAVFNYYVSDYLLYKLFTYDNHIIEIRKKLYNNYYGIDIYAEINKIKDDCENELEQFFIKYIYLVSIGESRHILSILADCKYTFKKYKELKLTGVNIKQLEKNIKTATQLTKDHYRLLKKVIKFDTPINKIIEKGIIGKNRSEIYKELDLIECNTEIINSMLNLFNYEIWNYDCYGNKRNKTYVGGKKWFNIVKVLHDYLNGRINKTVFVDTAISLSHNNRNFIDKILCNSIYTNYIELLEFKKSDFNYKYLLSIHDNIYMRYIPYNQKNNLISQLIKGVL